MTFTNQDPILEKISNTIKDKIRRKTGKTPDYLLSNLRLFREKHPEYFYNFVIDFSFGDICSDKNSKSPFKRNDFFILNLASWLLTKQCICFDNKCFNINTPRTYELNLNNIRNLIGKIVYIYNNTNNYNKYDGFFVFVNKRLDDESLNVYVLGDLVNKDNWNSKYLGMDIYSFGWEKSISIPKQTIPSLYKTNWSETDFDEMLLIIIARFLEYLGSNDIEAKTWIKNYNLLIEEVSNKPNPFIESDLGNIVDFKTITLPKCKETKIDIFDNFRSHQDYIKSFWFNTFSKFDNYPGQLNFKTLTLLENLSNIEICLHAYADSCFSKDYKPYTLYTILVKETIESIMINHNSDDSCSIKDLCSSYLIFDFFKTSSIRTSLKKKNFKNFKQIYDCITKCSYEIKKILKASNLEFLLNKDSKQFFGSDDTEYFDRRMDEIKKYQQEIYTVIGRIIVPPFSYKGILLSALNVLSFEASQTKSSNELNEIKKIYCALLSATCQISIRQSIDIESFYILLSLLDSWKSLSNDSLITDHVKSLINFGNLGYRHIPTKEDIFIPTGLMRFSLTKGFL